MCVCERERERERERARERERERESSSHIYMSSHTYHRRAGAPGVRALAAAIDDIPGHVQRQLLPRVWRYQDQADVTPI